MEDFCLEMNYRQQYIKQINFQAQVTKGSAAGFK